MESIITLSHRGWPYKHRVYPYVRWWLHIHSLLVRSPTHIFNMFFLSSSSSSLMDDYVSKEHFHNIWLLYVSKAWIVDYFNWFYIYIYKGLDSWGFDKAKIVDRWKQSYIYKLIGHMWIMLRTYVNIELVNPLTKRTLLTYKSPSGIFAV